MAMRTILFAIFFSVVFSCKKAPNDLVDPLETKVQMLLKEGKANGVGLDESKIKLDSAWLLTKARPLDSLTLSVIYAKSYLHYQLEQNDSTDHYDRLLRMKALQLSNTHYLGKAHMNLGYGFREQFAYDSAYYHFNQSKSIFQSLGDSSEVGKRLLSMAILQQTKGDYFGSKETLSEALDYLDTAKDKASVASAYNELATNHRRLLNTEDAIKAYQKAVDLAVSHSAIYTFQNNLAATLTDAGKYDKAISLLEELTEKLKTNPPNIKYARALDNLAYAQWLGGKDTTPTMFFEALNIRKKGNDKRGLLASYNHLGEFFAKQNVMLSEQYSDSVIHLSRELNTPAAETEALKRMMDLKPMKTLYKDRYIFLKDSMYQQELKVKTQFAKMKYDDEQKQLAILQLENDRERKNVELAEQRTQKAIWLSLSGLLVIGGISAYYSLRQRHKKEKLQEVYFTEKRISKKVHDELANDIYGFMTRLQHSKTTPVDEALDVLENIYIRTRNISHETGSIDTQNFQDELKKLLRQFRNDDTTIAVKGFSAIKWGSISEEKKITLYRILNELLVNMKKHSGATLVSIAFENKKKVIAIDYCDNGKGVQLPFQKGAGLSNTENRIKNSNGTFSFESEPGKGVRIKCAFPI